MAEVIDLVKCYEGDIDEIQKLKDKTASNLDLVRSTLLPLRDAAARYEATAQDNPKLVSGSTFAQYASQVVGRVYANIASLEKIEADLVGAYSVLSKLLIKLESP